MSNKRNTILQYPRIDRGSMTMNCLPAVSPILQYPRIDRGILADNKWQESLSVKTVAQLEKLLQSPQYAAVQRLDYETKAERKAAATVERVTGFGTNMANAFEVLSEQLQTIPTQEQFNDYCLQLAEQFWAESSPEGTSWNHSIEKAVTNRNYRCWIAQINELHCSLLIQELFPYWTVVNSNDIDLLMGVDLIVETEQKRLYLHIFKDSKYSFLAFRKKEQRGGRKDCNGKFHKYARDFTGDKALMYSARNVDTESTKFVNGIPLFKGEWLKNQLLTFDYYEQFGEPLKSGDKLQYLDNFLAELDSVEKEETV